MTTTISDTIANAAPAIVWIMEVATGRYTYINSAFTRVFGYPTDTVLERGVEFMLSIMHPEDLERVMGKHNSKVTELNATGRKAQDEYVHVDEYRMKDVNGQWRWIRSSGVVYERTENGEIRNVLGVAQDVTAFKQLESQLQVADRMASIGRLAAGVAHEINNPLAHLMASLELALDKGGGSVDALRDCLVSAERIAKVVHDLNVLSRPRDDQGAIADLHKAIDAACSIAMLEIRHRARLVKDYGAVGAVHGAEGRLVQVFLNLLANAAHAIPEGNATGNEIRIKTSIGSNGLVVVEVSDTGSGIPQDELKNIFEPFYTTKPVGEGTGLGLFISYNIIKLIGGSIEVESVLGRGTTFRVQLKPALGVAAATEVSGEARSVSPRGARARVLIVDDDVMVANILKDALTDEHEVEVVSDAHKALKRLLDVTREYDVVLCDLMMPGVTGIELFEQVKRDRPKLEQAFIFVTGGTLFESANEFLKRLPNQVIRKPFRLQAVRDTVRKALDSGSRLA